MSKFFSIKRFRHENRIHGLVLLSMFLLTFTAVGATLIFVLPVDQISLFWQILSGAPIVFGLLSYVVLGISLSYFSQRIFAKILCFATVATDNRNQQLVNSFLVNLLAINVIASIMILGHVALYFLQPSELILHVALLVQSSLIVPSIYCMRILEGCIDKIVNLESDIEKSCLHFINFSD